MSSSGAVATASPHKPYVTPYSEEVLDLPLVFEWVAGAPRLTYRDATATAPFRAVQFRERYTPDRSQGHDQPVPT